VNGSPLAALRRQVPSRPPQESCELCAAPLGRRHRHLWETSRRQLVCACDPCATLFGGQAQQRYRALPEQVRYLEGFELSDELWDGLLVPVGVAFFVRREEPAAGPPVIAMYPSPAGATQAALELRSWHVLEERNPSLRLMEPEVEALLVNRLGGARDHFLAPIDRCYELVGLVRVGWRGLSGGSELWQTLEGFFVDLRRQAVTLRCEDA
jgi:hypothetical protein